MAEEKDVNEATEARGLNFVEEEEIGRASCRERV